MIRGKVAALARKIAGHGLTPQQLALTIALGVTVGILPIPWGATPLCAFLAFWLGLNQAAIQGANYLALPLQLALFVPFYTLGARIFPRGPALSAELPFALSAPLKALGAWLLIAPLLAVVLYLLLLPITKRGAARFTQLP
ncbi:MAG: DUF2062 domain-containing protein [Geobacteraceae bacterium]|nr:DUF2062 domain-containing protein [Geobacteraceae bacterium]